MYSSVNYIYEQITALVRPSKTVYIYTSDDNKLDIKPNGETPLIGTNGKIDSSYLPEMSGGAVESVNGVMPDNYGNIVLGPDDVGAVPYEPLPNEPLIDDNNDKINTAYLPDYILGQVLFGGTVSQVEIGSGVVETQIYVSASLASKNNLIAGAIYPIFENSYGNYEGVYFIANHGFIFDNKNFETGDWLISDGSSWQKIDNTDAVQSVNGKTGAVVLTPADIGAIPNEPNGETPLIDTNGKIDSGYLPEYMLAGKTIEGQIFLKTGGEGDNKYGAISSISSDNSTAYLLRPYKNGAELHVVIGDSDVTSEIITKSRPIVKIGDTYDYMATKRDINNLTPTDIGALSQNDLTDYVKNTDFAANNVFATTGGVVKVAGSFYGIEIINGFISPTGGSIGGGEIDSIINRTNSVAKGYFANESKEKTVIMSGNIDYAIAEVLGNPLVELTEAQKQSAQDWIGGGVEWVANTSTALGDIPDKNILAVSITFLASKDGVSNGISIEKFYPYSSTLFHTSDIIFDGYSDFIQVFGVINGYRNDDGTLSFTVNTFTSNENANGVQVSIDRVLIKK